MIKKILFIESCSPLIYDTLHPYNIIPPLRIGYIISIIEKNGLDSEFIDCRVSLLSLEKLLEKTCKIDPDMVVVSFSTYDYEFTMEFCKKLKRKEPNIIITAIGQHVSFESESVIYKNSPIDFALLGECELEFLRFLKKIKFREELEKIECLYFYNKKTKSGISLVNDLDSLPTPKHTLFEPKKYRSVYPLRVRKKVKWGYIETSRGCPHTCTFCSQTIRESFGKKFRTRAAKNVVDEIEYLQNLGINTIFLTDDNFLTSKNHAEAVCDEIIKRDLDINWVVHVRADELSKEIMLKMKRAGCVLLKIGVESGSERIIKILRKTDSKIEWQKLIRKVFKDAEETSLPTHAFIMIGNPTETLGELKESMDLINTINPDLIQLHILTPYPGSKIHIKSSNKKLFSSHFHHYNPNIIDFVNMSKIPSKNLKSLLKIFYKQFYLRPTFIMKHVPKYGVFYLYNPEILKNLNYFRTFFK